METKAKTITEALAAVAGAIASFFWGLPPIIWILLAVMTIDYITGIICGMMGKSPNTETGGISSKVAFVGLLKKMLIILVVLLAALLDKAISMSAGITFEAVAGATCLWFIASEGFSIVENAAAMGIPVPKILLQALEIMRKKGDGAEPVKAEAQKAEEPEQAAEEQPADEPEKPPAEASCLNCWFGSMEPETAVITCKREDRVKDTEEACEYWNSKP